jgi:hypothetical protein
MKEVTMYFVQGADMGHNFVVVGFTSTYTINVNHH